MTTLQRPVRRPPECGTPPLPTLWGLNPIQLHDHYWAARGVQVVRLGESSAVVRSAELFMLTDETTLALFRVRPLVDLLSWINPTLLTVRLHETRHCEYQERAIAKPDGTFVRFERVYAHDCQFAARIAFTPDPDIARAWQAMSDTHLPWRHLRRHIPDKRRETKSLSGRIYNRRDLADLARFSRDLLRFWPSPSSVIPRAVPIGDGIWGDPESQVSSDTRFVDKVWIGAGRQTSSEKVVVGPAILWDDPAKRPIIDEICWQELEPSQSALRPVKLPARSSLSRSLKRGFDILLALIAILLTLPVYPFVMLAIFIEDGRPFFFGHKRETLGGREFACLKFRSMRKDAEKIKLALSKQNQADGPQFFMENDPRLTRVGRIIRKTNIDELPQFFNVLLGDMSIVGPRPSPRRENQFCPAWREARLSVRPGITGLWQVNRTRIRGTDFQEWIKYDIEYVERQSWLLDFRIIFKTIAVILKGIAS